MELELKTKDQTDFDYNRFFYATMCHVCKRFGDDVYLKRCSACKLISYCGKRHQKLHWAQHKFLCKAVQDVVKDGLWRYDRNLKWGNLKLALMTAVEEKKGSLEQYERQMFLFPKECAVCNEQNVESLIVCQKCAFTFCKDHKDDNAHKDACVHLELCLRIHLSDADNESIADMYLQRSSEVTDTILEFKDFINRYRNDIEGHSETPHDLLEAGLWAHFTCPLTILYAIHVLKYKTKSKEVVIHVIAASIFEQRTLNRWEILLHLVPEFEESLVIVIIRSELNYVSPSSSVCNNCLSRGKKISFEFYEGLYEDYVRSSSFVKPDFAVAFNAGIQVDDTYVAEITMLSIKMLAELNCPLILTNHTQDELEESINRINTILNRKVDPVCSERNSFRSLRPCRSILTRELVFFPNNFIAIYRSLCSCLMCVLQQPENYV